MADNELLQALDYILNKSDASSIEVLAEAVVRRRRGLFSYGAITNIDPHLFAKTMTEQLSAGIGGGLEGLKDSVREMTVRIIKEHAPELTEAQIEELCRAWIPNTQTEAKTLPRDLLVSMIEQFISFSHGTMSEAVNQNLRNEMGAWPERYWNAFPPVIRNIITEYLKDGISEDDFNRKITLTLDMV
jgi:hypothetical protein